VSIEFEYRDTHRQVPVPRIGAIVGPSVRANESCACPMTAVPRNTTPAPVVVDLSAATLRARLHDALAVYVAAMDYPRGTEHQRAPMWAEHTTRAGWQAVAAVVPDDSGRVDARTAPIVAIASGYRGAPHQR